MRSNNYFRCTDLPCHFVLSTGDNVYPNGATSAEDAQFDKWRDLFDGEGVSNLTWYVYIYIHMLYMAT